MSRSIAPRCLPTRLLKVPAVGGVPVAVTTLGKTSRDTVDRGGSRMAAIDSIMRRERSPSSARSTFWNWARANGCWSRRAPRSAWTPPGYLLFIGEGTLLAQHMNAGNFQLERSWQLLGSADEQSWQPLCPCHYVAPEFFLRHFGSPWPVCLTLC